MAVGLARVIADLISPTPRPCPLNLVVPAGDVEHVKRRGGAWNAELASWTAPAEGAPLLDRWRRSYLHVPFEEIAEVKPLGGRCNPARKLWYTHEANR